MGFLSVAPSTRPSNRMASGKWSSHISEPTCWTFVISSLVNFWLHRPSLSLSLSHLKSREFFSSIWCRHLHFNHALSGGEQHYLCLFLTVHSSVPRTSVLLSGRWFFNDIPSLKILMARRMVIFYCNIFYWHPYRFSIHSHIYT